MSSFVSQFYPSNNVAYNMQNVAKYAQKHGGVENGQTHSYNGGYEDDFARLQETSKELLKKFENSGTTYQEPDEGVRERYTRGI